jgi:hypothetical protein
MTLNIKEGKQLMHASDRSKGMAYPVCRMDWEAWCVINGRELLEEVINLREEVARLDRMKCGLQDAVRDMIDARKALLEEIDIMRETIEEFPIDGHR